MAITSFKGVLKAGDVAGLTTVSDIAYSQTEEDDGFGGTTIKMATSLKDKLDLIDEKLEHCGGQGGDISLNPTITLLISRIDLLESALRANEVTIISISLQSLNVSSNAGNLSIVITAEYTKSENANVTNEVTGNTSNQSVAKWNNEINKVEIIGAGTCTITFTYTYLGKSVTATLPITVTLLIPDTPVPTKMYYIGWATSYDLILKNSNFETSTLAKTWNDTNLKMYGNTYPTYLWACTPVGTIISSVNYGGISDTPSISTTVDEYNIYYLGYEPTDISGTILTITIQNNG